MLALAALCGTAQSDPSPRVRALLRRMTLEEKLSLLHGARDPHFLGQAGYWPGLPRLGIPSLRLADGPPGINVNQDATGMPAPVALAATFSTTAARQYGEVLGREARALGQDILLAPHINIVRDPLFRRNHTSLGEDPLLNGRLAAAEIEGIQSQGTMAAVKHLAGYNGALDVQIDERALHEIYLPAFEAAVRAGAASVMCAYNRLNGPWSCENGELQNATLRGQWGFRGFVVSDWGSVHSTQALIKGLDLEMPGRTLAGRDGPYFTDELRAAISKGEIPTEAVDRALGRILGVLERFGRLDANPAAPPADIEIERDAAVSRSVAAQAAVLLRNRESLLPLSAEDLASLAVIGPTAAQPAAGYLGERAYGFESRLIAPLAALGRACFSLPCREPQAPIAYSAAVDLTGVPIPAASLSHNSSPGLLRTSSASSATALDPTLDFAGPTALEPATDFAWSGTLTVPTAGDYTLMIQPSLTGGSEGGGTISIDGRQVARTGGPGFGGTGMAVKKWSSLVPTTDGRDNGRGTVRLSAGAHRIELTANSTGEAPLSIRFAWITPEARRAGIDAAVAVAKSARTAVVFAWSGMGGTFGLPEDQDELIARIAAANPRTIVVLNTGGPVAMPWKDAVPAILEVWYPGQEGGWATADLLLGRANPAGKLPVTFPVRVEDGPPRATGALQYSEGTAVGYRWYEREGITPLFPFGHGLSYTSFEYSDLSVTPRGANWDVAFALRNTGRRSGTEVAQIYLTSAMHSKSLAGFEAVTLAPGEARRVTVALDERSRSYWSVEKHAWVPLAGSGKIQVGASSADLRLSAAFPLPR